MSTRKEKPTEQIKPHTCDQNVPRRSTELLLEVSFSLVMGGIGLSLIVIALCLAAEMLGL
jgi:hypothetical protein